MIKPAKLIINEGDITKTQAASSMKEANVVERTDEHDYAMDVSMASKRKEDSAPTTPSKLPLGNKSKVIMELEVSNLTILEAIQSMEKKFDEQLAQLREQAKQSSCMIVSLTKAVQLNAEEVKDCKKNVSELEKHNECMSKENAELKERIREQERYKMRWCLKVKGSAEKSDENIRADIIQLFNKIAPNMEVRQLEEAIDIVHRVG